MKHRPFAMLTGIWLCSGLTVQVTLWGNLAEDVGAQLEADVSCGLNPVISISHLRITDFNGICCSLDGPTHPSPLSVIPSLPNPSSYEQKCISVRGFGILIEHLPLSKPRWIQITMLKDGISLLGTSCSSRTWVKYTKNSLLKMLLPGLCVQRFRSSRVNVAVTA